MHKKIGFIGCGNMGSAMAEGIAQSGLIKKEDILLYDTFATSAIRLAEKTGASVLTSPQEVAEEADYLVLAVKPYVYPEVLATIKGHVKKDAVIVVIAVGVSFGEVKELLEEDVKVVRVQPSTPALVGESDTTLCPDPTVSEEEVSELIDLLNCIGKTEILSEKLMDVVPGIASSAPAYTLMLIEAMADGGVLHGFPRDQAIRLAAQSVYGAAKMVLETGTHPAVLKDQICTPGGTTIEAVRALEDGAFRKTVIDAVDRCAKKSKKMMEKA